MNGRSQALSWPDLLAVLDDWQPGVAGTEASPRHDAAWLEIHRRLLRFAKIRLRAQLGLTSEDAEDLAQNTLLKLQEAPAWRRFKSASSIIGYLHVALRNQAIDLQRRRVHYSQLLRDALENPHREDRSLRDLNISLERLAVLTAALPRTDQELLRMRFWRGMSFNEIAAELSVPYSTAAGRMFRILKELRAHWGVED